jgi:tripartite-type tricarboxylate transporter receptor subunit TctC
MIGRSATKAAWRLTACLLALASNGAVAADVTFTKQIQFILGTAAGGGTDLEARLIGRYVGKHLPGNPQIVYRNIPGGNGVKGITYFVRQVKPDGYSVLYASNSRLNPLNVRKTEPEFDPVRFAMVGGSAADGTIVMVRKEAIPRITDPSARPVVMGSVDGGKSGIQMMVWGAEFLHWNLRWVVGYAGTTATMLALRSGEIEMASTGSLFQIRPLLETGQFVAFAQLGDRDADGTIHSRPPFDDVPLFPTMIDGKIAGKDEAAFRAWMNALQVNKWVGLPPSTPAPVVQAWRNAYQAAAADPDFIADVHKQIDSDWQPLSGETIQAIVTDLSRTPDDVLQLMIDYRKKHGLPTDQLRATDTETAQASETAGPQTARAMISAVEDGGRLLKFPVAGATHSAKVSSGRTVIRLGGKDAQRGDLKAGLDCDVTYDKDGGDAARVDCR